MLIFKQGNPCSHSLPKKVFSSYCQWSTISWVCCWPNLVSLSCQFIFPDNSNIHVYLSYLELIFHSDLLISFYGIHVGRRKYLSQSFPVMLECSGWCAVRDGLTQTEQLHTSQPLAQLFRHTLKTWDFLCQKYSPFVSQTKLLWSVRRLQQDLRFV